MSQPDAADPLIRAYQAADRRISEWAQRLVDNPKREAQLKRLLAQQRAIRSDMATLDALLAGWLTQELPKVFAAGAGGDVTWNLVNQDAVRILAERTYTDLLLATHNVDLRTRRLVQTVANDETLRQLLVGQDTPASGARRMRKILNERGVHAVTYANGAKMPVGPYSKMALRTVTATAYNTGTLNGADDIEWFEVFDGRGCGWTTHADPNEANGMIVSRTEALEHPISHPNCRRAFGPRPDIMVRPVREVTSV